MIIKVVLDTNAGVTQAEVDQMIAASKAQMKMLDRVYEKYPITFTTRKSPRAADIELLITRDADTAGALGYHDTKADGTPYIRVFTGDILGNGGSVLGEHGDPALSVSVCFMHEVLETWLDPDCVTWWTWGRRSIAAELCDPVQNDVYFIDVKGDSRVAVSNAILPAWWTPGKPGPFDVMQVLKKPFSVSKGGYAIVATASGVGQVFGDKNGTLRMNTKKLGFRAARALEPVAAIKQGTKETPVSRTAKRLMTLPDATT
jgi:hypothetical protein